MTEPPAWTLDTNVIVSGLLSPAGPPGRLVDAVLARQLRLALDDRVEQEYRAVLARPKFRIAPADLARVFGILPYQQHVTVIPNIHLTASEHADTKFLEVAAATTAKILVTGNLKHYPRAVRGKVRVLSPAEAMEEWQRHAASPLR